MKRFLSIASILGYCLFSNTADANTLLNQESQFDDIHQPDSTVHQSHHTLLYKFHQNSNIDELSESALIRSSQLQQLMMTNPYEALRLSDHLYESSSFNPHFNVLVLQGLVEKQFSQSRIDLTYACGMKFMDEHTRHLNFCEEKLYSHNEHRSYNVHIPIDFPLQKHWTHKDQILNGYILQDTAVVHPPQNMHIQAASNDNTDNDINPSLKEVPDYKRPTVLGVDSQRPLSLLLIQITFSDLNKVPGTQADLEIMGKETAEYFDSTSYGASTITKLVYSPLVTLSSSNDYFGDYNKLSVDGTDAAAKLGPMYDGNNYDLIVWLFPKLTGFAWAGLGYVGIKGVWDNGYVGSGFGVKVMCHELGHNFGMAHASAWKVFDGNTLSPQGQDDEYGDTFDMMGYGFGNPAHYNAFYKLSVNWLNFSTETASCGRTCPEYRGLVYPSDSVLSRGFVNAVDLVRSNDQPNGDHYWLSTKSSWPRDMLGLFVHTSSGSFGIPKVYLLNMHTEYNKNQGVSHAALQVGETFSDCIQNIHITNGGFDLCPKQTSIRCVDTIVKRITSTGNNVLTISISGVPANVEIGKSITLTAATSEQSTVSWNLQNDTYSNILGQTVTYTFKGPPRYQTVMVQATNLAGKFTRYFFTLSIGAVAGVAPSATTTDALGHTFTCGAGKVTGYSGGFSTANQASWYQGGFGACSVTCGGGVSSQSVTCRLNGAIVNDNQCKTPKPVSQISCSLNSCDSFVWFTTAWSTCTKSCDGGLKTRSVSCQVATSSTLVVGSTVDGSYCSQTGPSPPISVKCNNQQCSTGGLSNTNKDGSCLFAYGGSNCDEVPSVRVLEPIGLIMPGQSTLIKYITTGSAKTAQILLYGPASEWPIYIARATPVINSSFRNESLLNAYTWIPNVDDPVGAYRIDVLLNTEDGYDLGAGGRTQYVGESPTFTVQNLCKTIGVTCYYGGRCQNGACVCNNGATSANCDPCEGNTCNGKGVCSAYPESFGECVGCISGYSGVMCERAPGCAFKCDNGGLVNAECTACTCSTAFNYTGAHCDSCSLKCGANGAANSNCTACVCKSGYYTGPVSDTKGSQCSLTYVEVTVRLTKIVKQTFNSSLDISSVSSAIQLDIAFVLGVGMSAIEIRKLTWMDDKVYIVVWLKQQPSVGAVSPTLMLAKLKSSFQTALFAQGAVGRATDLNYGVQSGDATPATSSPFLSSSFIIAIIASAAILIVLIIIGCVVRWRRNKKYNSKYMTKEIHLTGHV